MPLMKFHTRIKYKGEVHKGLEPFDVSEEDVKEMQTRGGVVIIESDKPKEKPKQKPDKAPDKAEDKPVNMPDKEADKPDETQKRGKKKAAGE